MTPRIETRYSARLAARTAARSPRRRPRARRRAATARACPSMRPPVHSTPPGRWSTTRTRSPSRARSTRSPRFRRSSGCGGKGLSPAVRGTPGAVMDERSCILGTVRGPGREGAPASGPRARTGLCATGIGLSTKGTSARRRRRGVRSAKRPPEPWKNAVPVGQEISRTPLQPALHSLYQELANSAHATERSRRGAGRRRSPADARRGAGKGEGGRRTRRGGPGIGRAVAVGSRGQEPDRRSGRR